MSDQLDETEAFEQELKRKMETVNCVSRFELNPLHLCVLTDNGRVWRPTPVRGEPVTWTRTKQIINLKGKLDLTPVFMDLLSNTGLGTPDAWSLHLIHDRFILEARWDWGLTRPERRYRLTHLPEEWMRLVRFDSAEDEQKYLGVAQHTAN